MVPSAGSFDRLDPKDSFGWGVDVGFFVNPNVEVGFMYGNSCRSWWPAACSAHRIGKSVA